LLLPAVSGIAALVPMSSAFAFNWNHASSSANGAVKSPVIATPNITSVTAQSANSIKVSWSAPSSQLAGANYKVLDTTNSTTPCSGLSGSTTTCTDTGAYPGQSYSYVVVAYLPSTNWSKSSTPASATTPDVYSVSPATSQTAGGSFSVTVTAKKATSATNSALITDTGFAGTKSVTFSGPAASPNSTLPTYNGSAGSVSNPNVTLSSVTFTSGVSSSIATILYNAGPTTLTATTGSGGTAVTGSTSSFNVQAAAGTLSLSSCSVSSPSSSTCPSNGGTVNISQGAIFTATVSRSTTDPYGNALTLSAATGTVSVSNSSKGSITSGSSLSFAANSTSGGSFTYTEATSGTGDNTISIALTGWTNYTVMAHKQ
jgi:hypothetical protein